MTTIIAGKSAALLHKVSGMFPVTTQTGAGPGAEPLMVDQRTSAEFERLFLPHLDAAYNLARLLMRNAEDAGDVVQESYLKALRAFSGFRGESGRPWILAIVRNTAFTWLRSNRLRGDHTEYHEETHVTAGGTPEAESLGKERARAVEHCVQQLPSDFREAIVLRELEELSYNEISEITGVPRGTVMSRLSRARARLGECLKKSQALRPAKGGFDDL
jgi:RNA polymerase sigma-70 factor (ECF subfamily)